MSYTIDEYWTDADGIQRIKDDDSYLYGLLDKYGNVIVPCKYDMIIHFDVSRERSIKAIEEAMLHDQKIFLITQKDPETEMPGLLDLYQIGTIAYIKQVVKMPIFCVFL